MSPRGWQRSARLAALVLFMLSPSLAHGVDGVIEINQARALAGGVTSGDTPGYPVTISQPGSYRLTGNLTLPNANLDGIQVAASAVTIDLNHFTIRGPNTWDGGVTDCSAGGDGRAVFADSAYSGVVVSNGAVVGAGFSGVVLLGNNGRIERVIAEQNCFEGLRVGNASLVIDSTSIRNRGYGVTLGPSSRVTGTIANLNHSGGIRTSGTGYLTVESCITNGNGHDGIIAGIRSTIQGNQVANNEVNGIVADAGSSVLDNIVNGHAGPSIWIISGSAGSGGNVVTHGAGSTGFLGSVGHMVCDLDNGTKVCAP
ncbi:MAG: right-handed parallel beta-helix repeat-containing protein [bacterium]